MVYYLYYAMLCLINNFIETKLLMALLVNKRINTESGACKYAFFGVKLCVFLRLLFCLEICNGWGCFMDKAPHCPASRSE